MDTSNIPSLEHVRYTYGVESRSSVSTLIEMMSGNCDPDRPDRILAQADITTDRIIMHAEFVLAFFGGAQ